MKKDERWVYEDGELTGKITEKTFDNGDKEIVEQKAFHDFLGDHATTITKTTRIVK